MPLFLRSRGTILGIFILLIALGAAYVVYISHNKAGIPLDGPIKKAISRANELREYAQNVDTSMSFPDRTLRVEGTYLVNESKMAYDSQSTTTLTIPGITEHPSFTLHNISIGSDVYSTVDTQSPLLRASIQVSPWRHFKADAIPSSLAGVAISGPILDNLKLLDSDGIYLSLIRKAGMEQWSNESLLRYTFKLSGAQPPQSNTVTELMDLIGTGTVDIWIDSKTFDVRRFVFSNPPYFSTTTLSAFNATPDIVAPIGDSMIK